MLRSDIDWYRRERRTLYRSYAYSSERWNDLYLQGPFELTDLRVKSRTYGPRQIQGDPVPQGIAAELVSTAPLPEIAMRRKQVEKFTPQGHIGWHYFRDEALIDGRWVPPAEEEFF